MEYKPLRHYQVSAIDGVRAEYKRGINFPLLVIPTGGGKTKIFSEVAKTAFIKGKRIWILVHRIELLKQTSAQLHEIGVHHGLVNPAFTPDMRAMVQVVSVQTMVKRLDRFPPPDFIIIDEAHHATAGTWKNIIEYHKHARGLGVTATPIRADGKGLGVEFGGVFDSIVIGPQISQLIEEGFLVKPRVYRAPNKVDLAELKIVGGEYDEKKAVKLIDKPSITGDCVSHYKKLCDGVPAIVFCYNVEHANHVAESFRENGYRAYSVDGMTEYDQRKRILGGLGDGSVDVVCSVDIISEGTDIPNVGCVILLRHTFSLSKYLQQVGRGLRTVPGKEFCIILDHVGVSLVHGLPEDDRNWTLEGKKKGTRTLSMESTIRTLECPQCYSVHLPNEKVKETEEATIQMCPMCGFEYDPKPKRSNITIEDGELVEVTKEMKKIESKKRVNEISKIRTIEGLKEYEKEKGYKKGWASAIFNARNKPVQEAIKEVASSQLLLEVDDNDDDIIEDDTIDI